MTLMLKARRGFNVDDVRVNAGDVVAADSLPAKAVDKLLDKGVLVVVDKPKPRRAKGGE